MEIFLGVGSFIAVILLILFWIHRPKCMHEEISDMFSIKKIHEKNGYKIVGWNAGSEYFPHGIPVHHGIYVLHRCIEKKHFLRVVAYENMQLVSISDAEGSDIRPVVSQAWENLSLPIGDGVFSTRRGIWRTSYKMAVQDIVDNGVETKEPISFISED